VTPSGSALKVVRGYAKPSIRTGYWLSISAHREISAFLFLQKFFSNGEIGRWRGHGQMSASWLGAREGLLGKKNRRKNQQSGFGADG
jgi:hypothetical protein